MSDGGGDGSRRSGGLRALARGVLLVMIVALFAVSIPWYREAGGLPETVFGLPDWVAVALGCYVAVALLNCVAWLLTDVRDPGEDPS